MAYPPEREHTISGRGEAYLVRSVNCAFPVLVLYMASRHIGVDLLNDFIHLNSR